jgi:hypothetical protein
MVLDVGNKPYMGQPDILNKLRNKLSSIPNSEEDVIFILSKIRKVLDLDNYDLESKYGILRFYCNLAFHIHIDNVPKSLRDEIIKVHENQSLDHPFFGFNDFHIQMQQFISEYRMPNFYERSDFKGQKFTEILNSVYSDTPVTVNAIKKYQVVVNQDGTVTGKFI